MVRVLEKVSTKVRTRQTRGERGDSERERERVCVCVCMCVCVREFER